MENKTSKNTVLFIAALSSFLAPFMISAVNIALPAIEAELAMDAIELSWVPAAYLLTTGAFLLPAGKAADIYGRKRVFMYGIIIYTLSALLLSVSASPLEFIFYRVIEGVGAALMFATSGAIVSSVFSEKERGKAFGIVVAAVYLGLSAGPFLGGILTEELGWRSIFYVNVPVGIACVALILWKLKEEWADARGQRLDYVGSAVYMASLTAAAYGLSVLPSAEGLYLIFCGLVGLAAFLASEEKKESPLFDVRLFKKNRRFAFSNLAALINYSATYGIGFLLSLYLQYMKGMNPEYAGTVLIAQPVVQMAFSPLAGRLSDRIDAGTVASYGMALIVVGLSFFSMISESTSLEAIIATLVVLGLGFALFAAPNTNAVMGSVERKDYGIASAMLATTRITGQMLSIGTVMTVFALYIGHTEILPESYPMLMSSIRVSFTLFAVFCAFGIYASLVRGKKNV